MSYPIPSLDDAQIRREVLNELHIWDHASASGVRRGILSHTGHVLVRNRVERELFALVAEGKAELLDGDEPRFRVIP